MTLRNGLSVITISALALGVTGCKTTGENAGLGALIGAGVGAAIGAGSDEAATGAIIGAVVGAASGAIASDVRKTRAEKKRTAEETAEVYSYTPSQGQSLVLEESRIEPNIALPGELVDSSFQYALLGTGPGVEITETRLVKKDGVLMAQISSQNFTRNDGVWVSAQAFRIPEDWARGEYTLEQIAETVQSRILTVSRFTVR